MKDAGDPRRSSRVPGTEDPTAVGPATVVQSLMAFIQTVCLIAMALLMAVAAYYALSVFSHLGRVVADPSSLKGSADAMAEIIHADELGVEMNDGNRLETGHVVAVILLLFLYVLWIWVPLALIYTTGRILLRGVDRRSATNDRSPRP